MPFKNNFFKLLLFFIILNLNNEFENIRALDVSAKSACLIIADSCDVIFEKDSNKEMPMASTTKIMTSLLALENIEACGEKEIEINDKMVHIEGTSMGLMPNDIVNLEALAKGMLLCSGNDAATAVALSLAENEHSFADMMNEKAKQIGMKNTHFVTPSGLDKDNHHSTAYDMALLGAFAMENEKFVSIASKKSDKVQFINPPKTISMKNHNKLLRLYDGCIGIKTGFTKAAGRCLVSCAQRNDVKLVAVTLNAPNDWDDHKNMLDYGFANTINVSFNDFDFHSSIKIMGGDIDKINVCGLSSFSRTFKKGEEQKVKRIIDIKDTLSAPIEKGQIVGKISYFLNDVEIGKNDILSEETVNKKPEYKNIFDKIRNFFKKIFN